MLRKRSDGQSRRSGLLSAFRRGTGTGTRTGTDGSTTPAATTTPGSLVGLVPAAQIRVVEPGAGRPAGPGSVGPVPGGSRSGQVVAPGEVGWSGRGVSLRTGSRGSSTTLEVDLTDDTLVPFGVPTGNPREAVRLSSTALHGMPPGQIGRPRGLEPIEVIELPDWDLLPSMEVRVDLTGVERRRARQATRKALNWHGNFVIVHTGNIGIRQGLEELAGALRRLAEVQPDVLVAFIGNGNRRQALVRATAGLPNVEIRDAVPPDQLFAVLLAGDLLLVSERSDGQDITAPSKLTSYFAAARPVMAVVSRGSATAAEVFRSGAGVLVDPGDPLGFTAQVAALRSDPAERARLGDAGLRFVANEAMSRLA
ncbi:MAG TPA: glycosyltransferase [Kineosporiaceae bacterium]|nr:glycosyltransferase [Kineosporiaceae bacterium]